MSEDHSDRAVFSWEDDGGRNHPTPEEPPMPGDNDAPSLTTSWPSEEECRRADAILARVDEVLKESGEYEPITLEAHGLVFGDRNRDYGHPVEDFSRTAGFWTNYLADKFKPGEYIAAEDVGILMCLLKISRQRNKAKRDNLVDLCGYAETVQRIIDFRKGVKGA